MKTEPLPTSGKDAIRKWSLSPVKRALLALLLVVMIGIVFNAHGTFLKWDTHRDMLRQISVYGIVACGMTLVIITGGIDLSVGSLLGMTAVVFSLLSIQWHWAVGPAITVTLLVGTVAGLISATLVARFRVQPFIATLAMMVFARGVAKWISGGQKISTAIPKSDGTYDYVGPPPVFDLVNAKLLGDNIAVITIVFLVCVGLCWILLGRLRWGRHLYAIGGNEEAARLSGISVLNTKRLAYGLSGLFAALAGIGQACQEFQGDPETGGGYELTAIAIVVIGGTSLMGGRGGIGLTLLGALTIGYLEKILSINAVSESSRLMLTGLIIVVAVLFQKSRR